MHKVSVIRLFGNRSTAPFFQDQRENNTLGISPWQKHLLHGLIQARESGLSGVADVARGHASHHSHARPGLPGRGDDLGGGQQEAVGPPVAQLHREGVLYARYSLRPVVRWTCSYEGFKIRMSLLGSCFFFRWRLWGLNFLSHKYSLKEGVSVVLQENWKRKNCSIAIQFILWNLFMPPRRDDLILHENNWMIEEYQ